MNKALFVYSKNCHGCKKFLPLYEELALEGWKDESNFLTYFRMNNDTNNSPHLEHFYATP